LFNDLLRTPSPVTIFETVAMAFQYNATSCSNVGGIPGVLPIGNEAVCGVTTLGNVSIGSCCDSPNDVRNYKCSQYCTTSSDAAKWYQCVVGGSNSFVDPNFVFCQSRAIANNTVTLKKSFACLHASPPRKTYYFMLLLLSTFLIGTASAEVIPSLAGNLVARQSQAQTSCSIQVVGDYTQAGGPKKVARNVPFCPTQVCRETVDVQTGITNNNRTINRTSAAEPRYDAFFDVLANRTGYMFPAMSGIDFVYQYVYSEANFLTLYFIQVGRRNEDLLRTRSLQFYSNR
jgi:hypothetical protein